MAERRDDARGRGVQLNNFWMVVAIVGALAVGYAWGRPSVQTTTPPATTSPPQTVVTLTPEQAEELARVAEALAALDDRERAALDPTERHAVETAEQLMDDLTAPAAPTTTAPPATAPPLPTTSVAPESGPIEWTDPPAATPSSTVP